MFPQADIDGDPTNRVTIVFDVTDKYFVSDVLNEITTAADGNTTYTLSKSLFAFNALRYVPDSFEV